MVIDLSGFVIHPESFHIGLDDYIHKWLEEVEDKPGINHLDIGSFGEIVANVDKHRGEN